MLLGITFGWNIVLTWTTLALLAWNIWRARKDLRTSFREAACLDRAVFDRDSLSEGDEAEVADKRFLNG